MTRTMITQKGSSELTGHRLLTREEHYARAMLLGRVYDPRDGTYCVASFDGDYSVSEPYLDCVTLEVIPDDDARRRMVKHGGYRADPSTQSYPWEAVDDEDDT